MDPLAGTVLFAIGVVCGAIAMLVTVAMIEWDPGDDEDGD